MRIYGPIPSIRDVKIYPLKPLGDRGTSAHTWNIPCEFGAIKTALRYPGDIAGWHFHPRVLGKDPERCLVFLGICTVWFCDIDGNREEVVINATQGPIMIEMPPYILHGIYNIELTIMFLEQALHFDARHVNFSRDDFDALRRSHASR